MVNENLGKLLLTALETKEIKNYFDKIHETYKQEVFNQFKVCYRICKSLEKEVKNPSGLETRKIKISGGVCADEFEIYIDNPTIRYHRKTILPIELKPYFEKIQRKFEAGDYKVPIKKIPEKTKKELNLARKLILANGKLTLGELTKKAGFKCNSHLVWLLRKYFHQTYNQWGNNLPPIL